MYTYSQLAVIFQNPPDSAIKSYNHCFKPSIISAEKQFILTGDALQHISTLLKEKAKVSPVVIQDSNDPSEKKTNIKAMGKMWQYCTTCISK